MHNFQVRGTDGTWQFIARVKYPRETPVSRGDAYGLVEEFRAAMAVMDNHKDGAEGRVEAFTSPMQNDMHVLQVRRSCAVVIAEAGFRVEGRIKYK